MNKITKVYQEICIDKCPRCNKFKLGIIEIGNVPSQNELAFYCKGCGKSFITILQNGFLNELLRGEKKSIDVYTIPTIKNDYYLYIRYCPETFSSVFEEMLVTFDDQCYKSCVVMARRLMQQIARDTLVKNNLTASKDTLNIELQTLKDNGVILSRTY